MGIVSSVILAELEFTSITRPRKEIQSLHNHQNLSKTKEAFEGFYVAGFELTVTPDMEGIDCCCRFLGSHI